MDPTYMYVATYTYIHVHVVCSDIYVHCIDSA